MALDIYGDEIPLGGEYRLGTRRFRHPTVGNGLMSSAVFSPCGKWLATGSRDIPSVSLFDAESGRQVHFLMGESNDGGVYDLNFSPDSKWLIAKYEWSRTVQIWDVENGDRVSLDLPNTVRALDFDQSGEILALGHNSGITILSLPERDPVAHLPLKQGRISAGCDLRITEDAVFVIDQHEGEIWVWRYAQNDEVKKWRCVAKDEQHSIEHFFISPDRRTLAVVSEGFPELVKSSSPELQRGAWKPKTNRQIHLLNTRSLHWKSRSVSVDGYVMHSMQFTADSRSIVFPDDAKSGKPRNLKLAGTSSNSKTKIFHNTKVYLDSLCVSRRDQNVGYLQFEDSQAERNRSHAVWFDLTQGKVLKRFETSWLPECLAISPNETRMAAACRDGHIDMFDLTSGNPIHKADSGPIKHFAINDQSAYVVTVDQRATVRGWQLDDSSCKATLAELAFNVKDMATQPDKTALILHTHPNKPIITRLSLVNAEAACVWTTELKEGAQCEKPTVCDDGSIALIDRKNQRLRKFELATGFETDSENLPELKDGHPYYGITSNGIPWALSQNSSEGALIVETNRRVKLKWPKSFDRDYSWLLHMIRNPRCESQVACCFGTAKDNEYSCTAMLWDLEHPTHVEALRLPYNEGATFGIGEPCLAFDALNRCLIAYFSISELSFDDDHYWNLRVCELRGNQPLLELPELDRQERIFPCYEMKAGFSDTGARFGCTFDDRLLIWELEKF